MTEKGGSEKVINEKKSKIMKFVDERSFFDH